MVIGGDDYVAVSGQFDLIFKDKCPEHPVINWQLMKSLAFNLSELHPYVDGGLFRIPNRLYFEYEGKDPYDPSDNIKTMKKILFDWWDRLWMVAEDQRVYFILLAFKCKIYNIESLPQISKDFNDFYLYFSPGLISEVKRIVDYLQVM